MSVDHFRAQLRRAYVDGLAALSAASARVQWDEFSRIRYALEMLLEAEAVVMEPLGKGDENGAPEAYMARHGSVLYRYDRVRIGTVDEATGKWVAGGSGSGIQ